MQTINLNLRLETVGEIVIATLTDPSGREVYKNVFTKQDIPVIQGVVNGLSSYFKPEHDTTLN